MKMVGIAHVRKMVNFVTISIKGKFMGKYDNLKNKTIFDFCDDVDVLRFITKQEKPSLAEYVKNADSRIRIMDLVLLAEITDNDDFAEVVFPLLKWTYDWNEETCAFMRSYQRKHGKCNDA